MILQTLFSLFFL